MADHPDDSEGAGRNRRSRVGLKGLLVLAALFVIWIGLGIRDNLMGYDPIRLIRSGNVAERTQAAMDLRSVSRGGRLEARFAALIHALGDEEAGVRAMAAQSLGVLATEQLGLAGGTPGEKASIKKWTDVVADSLIKSLADPNEDVRAVTATSLGLLGERSTGTPPPELIAALKDQSAVVRAKAVGSLSHFARCDDSTIPSFLSMLENDEAEVRKACADALKAARPASALVPNLIEALRSHNREVRFQSARLLGRIGAEARAAVPSLILLLKEPFDPEMSRTRVGATEWDPSCQAAIALGQIASNEEVIAALVETLSSGSPEQRGIAELRLSAAEALGRIGPRAASAAPTLIDALNALLDAKQEMPGAYAMAVALGHIAPNSQSAKGAVTTLIRVLDSTRYQLARVGAAEALGTFGPDAAAAIPKLRALATEPSSPEKTRHAMSEALDAIERESQPAGVNSPAR
jgi:HEAT repeat protein